MQDEELGSVTPVQPLPFTDRIVLRDITFGYPNTERPVFDGFSLELKANSTVGIVGSTGSGKTTLIDILLGLLAPRSGQL